MAGNHGEPFGRGGWAGEWQTTPWLWRVVLRKPKRRRLITLVHVGGDFSYWEYRP